VAKRKPAGAARKRAPAKRPRKPPVAIVVRAPRRVVARYDAYATTDHNRRHWANADALSADAANSVDVRRTLRNRARYEVANNSYARGIVNTLANNAIGRGPRLQLIGPDRVANSVVESAFSEWCRAVGLTAKLLTMRKSAAESGEAFAVLANNPALATAVKLDVRLIEADQIATPALSVAAGSVDGIELDAYDNPTGYSVLSAHPGAATFGSTLGTATTVPAAYMCHLYRVDRPGQHRGIPEITPALPLFAELRRYTLAVLAAAETAADLAGVLETDAAPPGDDETDAEIVGDSIEPERGRMVALPKGYKLSQLKAEQPTTAYEAFKRELVTEIARCLDMPYNIAACDSSKYNYASGRLDHQTYYRSIDVDRARIEAQVLDRVFASWCAEARLAGIDGVTPAWWAQWGDSTPGHSWMWPGIEHVDPSKEAVAAETKLRSLQTTYAKVYADQGEDWAEAFGQVAREKALMLELGLSPGDVTPAPQQEVTDEEG
jgi:lambda family phage portal protein